MPAWFCACVVGACGWHSNERDRSAEHAYAADRFAREIVGFLTLFGGALAAADRQTVGRARDCAFITMKSDGASLPAGTHVSPDEAPHIGASRATGSVIGAISFTVANRRLLLAHQLHLHR